MTADGTIQIALAHLAIPYREEIYYGTEKKYITYNESDQIPYLYADNASVEQKTFYQVHYFCPLQPESEEDSREITRKIRKILCRYGFCITGTARRREDGLRHVIIECNLITKNEEREEN